MFQIFRTPEFDAWIASLTDRLTVKRLLRRIQKAEAGNLGDVKPVGGSVWEMREFFGPGWRMYYVVHNSMLVVMLGGGGKATQSADIAAAIALAKTLED